MSAIKQDVEILRQQLQQAEAKLKLQQDKERLDKEQTWEYNMDIIKDKVKTANIKQNNNNLEPKRAAFQQDYRVYGFERESINDRRRQELERQSAKNSRWHKKTRLPNSAAEHLHPIPYRKDREGREYILSTELDACARARMPGNVMECAIFKVSYPFMKSVGICLERLERTIKQQQEKIDNLENRLLLSRELHGQTLALLTAETDDIVPSVQVLKHRQTQLEKALCKNNGSSLAQNPSC